MSSLRQHKLNRTQQWQLPSRYVRFASPLNINRKVAIELQACLESMQRVCPRWPIKIVSQQKREWLLHIQGWPSNTRIEISTSTLRLSIWHHRLFWDALVWPDVSAFKRRHRWHLTYPQPLATAFSELREVLWTYLFEPLTQFLNALPQQTVLELLGHTKLGVTMAVVKNVNDQPTKSKLPCVAAYLIEDTNINSNNASI
jgi:hypothetical protein